MIKLSDPILFDLNDFIIGDPLMDAQHARIINSINHLYKARFTFDHEQIREILVTLIEHTKEHFQLEEVEMYACGYPDAINHALEHKTLLDIGYHFLARFDNEEDIGEDLQKFLLNWLSNHILYSDRKVIDFCNLH